MSKLDFLIKIQDLLKNPKQESLNLSLHNTHHKGVFSLVIDGLEFGKLTRIFISNHEIKPNTVQLHTHRYPIRITAIKGDIKQHRAYPTEIEDSYSTQLSVFRYDSPINGGNGLSYLKEGFFILKDHSFPVGSSMQMNEDEFHTMSCSEGSIWVVEEQGFKKDYSMVLGIPFTTNNFYTKACPLIIQQSVDLVSTELGILIDSYQNIK